MQFWQVQALETLDKLFDPIGERQTGRTYVIAVALIRAAARNPGLSVNYIDHHKMDTRIIRYYIEQLIQYDKKLSSCFSSGRDKFHLNLPEPIENWLPGHDYRIKPNTIWDRLRDKL